MYSRGGCITDNRKPIMVNSIIVVIDIDILILVDFSILLYFSILQYTSVQYTSVPADLVCHIILTVLCCYRTVIEVKVEV